MSELDLVDGESLFYIHNKPVDGNPTLVFVNALIGQTDMWEGVIGETLRLGGYGTLSYNFRGQLNSKFSSSRQLTPELILEDLLILLNKIKPSRPILVGLSIGGLFAAQAATSDIKAEGLVLINTLRRPNLRLDWINEATSVAFRLGGAALLKDMMLPMLVNPQKINELRKEAFASDVYAPPPRTDGHVNLMRNSVLANWDFPWSDIQVPILVMTGMHDRVFLIEDDVKEILKSMQNATHLKFEDAGHLLPMETPTEFSDEIIRFLTANF